MRPYQYGLLALVAASAIVGVAGCHTPEDDTGVAVGNATPGKPPTAANPYGLWTPMELAESCYRLFDRHKAVHDLDLQAGTIRWGCGDVPGVTAPDLGQEYCEYNAVQNGQIVTKAEELKEGPVSCVFTSVFNDAFGVADRTDSNDADGGVIDDATFIARTLQQPMAAPENLGVAAADPTIVRMKAGFNSRGAANALLDTCNTKAGDIPAVIARDRVAACFLEIAKGGENAAALTTACKENLGDEAKWAAVTALGVKTKAVGEEGFEPQRDLTSCMAVGQVVKYPLQGLPPPPYPQVPYILSTVGVPWRNSDPMICSRTSRATNECSCEFQQVEVAAPDGTTYRQAIPDSLKGLPFTGWVDDHIPAGCRLAKVDGKDYPFIAICDLTAQEVSDIPANAQYARSIQNLCHDRFGVNLVMKLPLRDLQSPETCKDTGAFCHEYMSVAPAAPVVAQAGAAVTPPAGEAPRVAGAPKIPPAVANAAAAAPAQAAK